MAAEVVRSAVDDSEESGSSEDVEDAASSVERGVAASATLAGRVLATVPVGVGTSSAATDALTSSRLICTVMRDADSATNFAECGRRSFTRTASV